MRYSVETSLEDFGFWSGARDVMDLIREHEAEAEAELLVEQFCELSEELPTETEINDYVWFDIENDLKDIYGIDINA